MEISSAIRTIHRGSEYSPQTRKLCWGSLQTCLISVEPHRGEKSAALCCLRTDFSRTSLCVFMPFWPAVDLQYFHVSSSFSKWSNWQCRVCCSPKLLPVVIHQIIVHLSFPKSLSTCVCGPVHWVIVFISHEDSKKKKQITTLLMCLACARFCAICESAWQGSLCLGLRVTKVYG